MPQQRNVDVISINWEGSFDYRNVLEGELDTRFLNGGLYQIYCNHFEDNSLMYIGMTESSFRERIFSKKEWLDWESKIPQIFAGEIVNVVSGDDRHDLIRRAERLLIFYCSPPVNKQEKEAWYQVNNADDTVIINFNRRFRLPYVVSNLVDKTDIYERAGGSVEKARERVRERSAD